MCLMKKLQNPRAQIMSTETQMRLIQQSHTFPCPGLTQPRNPEPAKRQHLKKEKWGKQEISLVSFKSDMLQIPAYTKYSSGSFQRVQEKQSRPGSHA